MYIMFDDMPNVDRVLQLCLDIYLVRERKELPVRQATVPVPLPRNADKVDTTGSNRVASSTVNFSCYYVKDETSNIQKTQLFEIQFIKCMVY